MIHLTHKPKRRDGLVDTNHEILCGKIFTHPEPDTTYLDVDSFESNAATWSTRLESFCTGCLSSYTGRALKAEKVAS